MSKMRPMVFVTQSGKVEIQERPIPPLNESDVLIKVKATTLCGSDLHIFKGKHPAVSLPVPVGHEISGEVKARLIQNGPNIVDVIVHLEPDEAAKENPVR